MKLFKLSLLIIISLILTVPPLWPQGMNGGRGLVHVRSAWTLKPGYLTMYNHTRFFGKVGIASTPTKARTATTYWDVQGGISFNYGINKHIEAALSPILYQDNHKKDPGYNLPDDLFLSLKLGSYGTQGSTLSYGTMLNFRFPTGKEHNIIFEPYSAGTVEWGFTGLLTYARDPLYPEDALNVHLNLGYQNHNDVGMKFTKHKKDTIEVLSMSQELLYGIGTRFPTAQFDFSMELTGNFYIQKPPKTAYSIENYVYLTPAIVYKAYRWLSLEVSGDFLLTSAKNDETDYTVQSRIPEMPNYPGWRISLGARITLLPTTAYRVSEKDILMRKAQSRRELFEQIIKEQRETESAEEELERIKNERRKAERELERLRRILEGEGTKEKKQETDEKSPLNP
ncbi:hypothetical protein JW964_16965 [candidate division KSB1 bacterium]|nr:hypothetical protein [candidate division KSB1 bacterium]